MILQIRANFLPEQRFAEIGSIGVMGENLASRTVLHAKASGKLDRRSLLKGAYISIQPATTSTLRSRVAQK
jgi:hypothetical protein